MFCNNETEKKAIRRSSRREEYDPEGIAVSQVGLVGSMDQAQLNLTNIGFEGESRCTTPIASYQLGDHCTVTILQGRLVDVTSECVVRCTTTENIPLENDSLPGVAQCTREDRPDAKDGRFDRLQVYHNRDQPRLTVVVPFNDSGQIINPGNKRRVYEDYLLYFRQVLNLIMKLSVRSVAIQVPTWYKETEWRTQVTSALWEAIVRRAHRFHATMRVLIVHPEKGIVQGAYQVMEVLCSGHMEDWIFKKLEKVGDASPQDRTGSRDRVLDLGHVMASIQKAEIQGGQCWYLTGHIAGSS